MSPPVTPQLRNSARPKSGANGDRFIRNCTAASRSDTAGVSDDITRPGRMEGRAGSAQRGQVDGLEHGEENRVSLIHLRSYSAK
ncbi:hypothetical protein BURKHO8Y_480018 [Burkholderia sp. 8Y]|nr:hypothetical protein BURKHO8Y_480018 [Burkholderia sp. 8Y]